MTNWADADLNDIRRLLITDCTVKLPSGDEIHIPGPLTIEQMERRVFETIAGPLADAD